MLYVLLYFSPDILTKQKATMREIVDKHFNDNFVIATYMGHIKDLTFEWSFYPAAKEALDNFFTIPYIQQLNEKNITAIKKVSSSVHLIYAPSCCSFTFLLDPS
jgi:WASH complex subunit strumpellin